MIRLRIALLFSVLTGLALLLFMSLVFITSRFNVEKHFYDDLYAKAKLGAQVELEKDELTAEIYDEIINQHMDKLPDEQEHVIDVVDLNKAYKEGLISDDAANRILNDGRVSFQKQDRQWVGIFYPDNEGDFIILMSAQNLQGAAELSQLLRSMSFGLIITMLVQFVVGYFFARSITFPLIAIARQAEQISTTDLSSRFAIRNKKDELGQVIYRLNEMLDRLERGFETQRKFISHASHELKTPLTVILGESDLALKKERSMEEYVATLTAVYNQGEKLTQILANLIQLTEVSSGGSEYFEKTVFQVEELIFEIQAELHQTGLGAERICVAYGDTTDHQRDYSLRANRDWLRIALFNVIGNALKFSKDPVHISTSYLMMGQNERLVQIVVMDQGIGIPLDELEYIRNPFYRAKNAGDVKGSGIGLSIVSQILNLHDGNLIIHSEEGKGTSVTMSLPLT